MDTHNLAESQNHCVIVTARSEKNDKAGPMAESGNFSDMSAFTSLTHFCIRYTKTCQGNYPPLFLVSLPYFFN
jgi:hypothetical protein